MKYIVIFLVSLPLCAVAQTQRDYNNFMTRFVDYYNNRSTDKICSLFPPPKNEKENCFWSSIKADEEKSIYEVYGPIKKYDYLGVDTTDPAKVVVFRVLFANKGVKALSFNTKDKKFQNFRFDTSSELIEQMLKKR